MDLSSHSRFCRLRSKRKEALGVHDEKSYGVQKFSKISGTCHLPAEEIMGTGEGRGLFPQVVGWREGPSHGNQT